MGSRKKDENAFPILIGFVDGITMAYVTALACVIRLLVAFSSKKEISEARNLLFVFRKTTFKLFPKSVQTYNVHLLCHLAQQVQDHGTLSNLSAFAFESANYHLTRCISCFNTKTLFCRALDSKVQVSRFLTSH